jgi:hypothetical protein
MGYAQLEIHRAASIRIETLLQNPAANGLCMLIVRTGTRIVGTFIIHFFASMSVH